MERDETDRSYCQTACNSAKYVQVRVTGAENVVMEDNETTLPQPYERIQKTINFLMGAKPEAFSGKEECEVVMKAGPKVHYPHCIRLSFVVDCHQELKFTGMDYIQNFSLPSFFVRHDILQHGRS